MTGSMKAYLVSDLGAQSLQLIGSGLSGWLAACALFSVHLLPSALALFFKLTLFLGCGSSSSQNAGDAIGGNEPDKKKKKKKVIFR